MRAGVLWLVRDAWCSFGLFLATGLLPQSCAPFGTMLYATETAASPMVEEPLPINEGAGIAAFG